MRDASGGDSDLWDGVGHPADLRPGGAWTKADGMALRYADTHLGLTCFVLSRSR